MWEPFKVGGPNSDDGTDPLVLSVIKIPLSSAPMEIRLELDFIIFLGN
jgi:hypothetical protein